MCPTHSEPPVHPGRVDLYCRAVHLVDLPAFYPPHRGGVETYAHELHQRLLATDPDLRITVLTSEVGASPGREVLGDRWTVIRWPALQPVPLYPMPRPGFRRLVRDHLGPDTVLMTHTRFYRHAAIAGNLAKKHGVGWLHVEHGSTPVQAGGTLVRRTADTVDLTMGRPLLQAADRVIAVSAASADFVKRLSGREARVLYRGVELPHGLSANPPATGEPVLCCVGRLITSKGIADLFHAVAQLDREGTRVRVRLVGDGPDRGEFERLAERLGIADRVTFLGSTEHLVALEEMARATVMVNPSWTEGLPTTVLEAAALGCAVVATDVGGTSEIVTDGESGWVVPERRPDLLAAALRAALNDPSERSRRAMRLAVQARDKFSWERTVAGYLELLHELHATSATRP